MCADITDLYSDALLPLQLLKLNSTLITAIITINFIDFFMLSPREYYKILFITLVNTLTQSLFPIIRVSFIPKNELCSSIQTLKNNFSVRFLVGIYVWFVFVRC